MRELATSVQLGSFVNRYSEEDTKFCFVMALLDHQRRIADVRVMSATPPVAVELMTLSDGRKSIRSLAELAQTAHGRRTRAASQCAIKNVPDAKRERGIFFRRHSRTPLPKQEVASVIVPHQRCFVLAMGHCQ